MMETKEAAVIRIFAVMKGFETKEDISRNIELAMTVGTTAKEAEKSIVEGIREWVDWEDSEEVEIVAERLERIYG